jgi:ribosome-associated protein
MLRITDSIAVDESELAFSFVRSPGPGGQNVNKVATACQLRFDAAACASLPEEVKRRLRALAGKRMTTSGELILVARRHRTQGQNRQDAVERLIALVRAAATLPKKRRPTRPTAASRQRRLQSKLRRGQVKRLRRHTQEEQ